MARHSLYDGEIQELADDYLLNYAELGDVLPTVAGLALALNVSRTTIYNWSDDDKRPALVYTLGKLKLMQEVRLINGGLSGKFNSAITKLMLSNHGYCERKDEPQKEDKAKFVIVTSAVRD